MTAPAPAAPSLTDLRICIDGRPRRSSRSPSRGGGGEIAAPSLQHAIAADPDRRSRMALLAGKLWAPGQTLRVSFLGGEPAVKDRVAEVARQWTKHANLDLAFGDDPGAQIRIGFVQGEGSWSCIGKDCLDVPPKEPTMNLGWLTSDTPEQDCLRVVLHEFGHALGCVHEHQSPAVGIKWNKPVVYEHFAAAYGWSKQEVDTNLFDAYAKDASQFTAFDPASIMLYPVAKEHTLDGFEVGWNRALSETDKQYIRQTYPGRP
jgi:hypothetical protein